VTLPCPCVCAVPWQGQRRSNPSAWTYLTGRRTAAVQRSPELRPHTWEVFGPQSPHFGNANSSQALSLSRPVPGATGSPPLAWTTVGLPCSRGWTFKTNPADKENIGFSFFGCSAVLTRRHSPSSHLVVTFQLVLNSCFPNLPHATPRSLLHAWAGKSGSSSHTSI